MQWFTGIVIALYLALLALCNISPIQKWSSRQLASLLSDVLHTQVEIDKIQLGLFNRVIVDGIRIYDQQDSLMIDVARVAAKMNPLLLIENKIHLNNAQLFGANAHLYKNSEKEALNLQFLIDALQSKDSTEKKPIDLRIGKLLVRRASIRYDVYNHAPKEEGIDLRHIQISNLGFNAQINYLTPDSIDLRLSRFCMQEKGGLSITEWGFDWQANTRKTSLTNFRLKLPSSQVSIPSLVLAYDSFSIKDCDWKTWYKSIQGKGKLEIDITPSDFAFWMPRLSTWQSSLHASTEIIANEGNIELPSLVVIDKGEHLTLQAESEIKEWMEEQPSAHAHIHSLACDAEFIRQIQTHFNKNASPENPLLNRTQKIEIKGDVTYQMDEINTRLQLHSPIGRGVLEGVCTEKNKINAHLGLKEIKIGQLFEENNPHQFNNLSLDFKLKGLIRDEDQKPSLHLTGNISDFDFHQYTHKNIAIDAQCKGSEYWLAIENADSICRFNMETQIRWDSLYKSVICQMYVPQISLHETRLIPSKEETLRFKLHTQLTGNSLNTVEGNLLLRDFIIENDSLGPNRIDSLQINISQDKDKKNLQIASPLINGHIKGAYRWENLAQSFKQIISEYVPTLVPYSNLSLSDEIDFDLNIIDTLFLKRLAEIDLSIPQLARLYGRMNAHENNLQVQFAIPTLHYSNEKLTDIRLSVHTMPEMLQSSLQLDRHVKGNPVRVHLNTYMGYDKIRAHFGWDNNLQPKQKGEINATGIFFTGRDGKRALHTQLASSHITIADTVWTLQPSVIEYHDDVVDIHRFKVNHADRFLGINGRISGNETDSVTVDLNKINLEYIFQLINFNAVEFAGNATGHIYAKQLLKSPIAEAHLNVSDFTFNQGMMGEMNVYGNWGIHGNHIFLDADIKEHAEDTLRQRTLVQGTITPGKGEKGGLDLKVNANGTNIYFLNKFTKEIFENLQGNVSGYARIYGPFKRLNLEGNLLANEVHLGIQSLGTQYSIYGDSILLKPNHMVIPRATAYDYLGQKGSLEHCAYVQGELRHNCLKDLNYHFDIQANNVLGYNFKDFGDENFYGTVYANGQVVLDGEPGVLQVNIKGTPLSGTQFVYNVSSPETIREAGFISYVNSLDSINTDTPHTAIHTPSDQEDEEENDIYLNFDMEITPDATMKLLMDPKSGDYINLNGNGRIRATYHNKGAFKMYGVYHVDHGLYKLSIQDFIRKDFTFQRGGTITFGGDAYQASLNLKAIYSVPNVSLSDLSSHSLGFSNTRVDCIMHITGSPAKPEVGFDFDLPNANEDERQMIRSIVRTEEEKNMQAIYLLGIGRFFNNEAQYSANNNQSNTAMNSLISSTLSSQFNQIMNQMLNNNNWSFGANLRTGETGWDEIDVEGILSGRFFNNRLLFNGNFGYRESLYSNNNFIGDFDVQYLLTPNGNISLKAYNETNDRYFIQSSLTTQGVGILLKKDFNRLGELFFKKRKRTKP